MNTVTKPKSIRQLSRVEQDVLGALPDGIDVDDRPEVMAIGCGNFHLLYERDFVISGQDGRKLIVEVQPPEGISWSNMGTFVMVNRTARQAGAVFLSLLLGQRAGTQDRGRRTSTKFLFRISPIRPARCALCLRLCGKSRGSDARPSSES